MALAELIEKQGAFMKITMSQYDPIDLKLTHAAAVLEAIQEAQMAHPGQEYMYATGAAESLVREAHAMLEAIRESQ